MEIIKKLTAACLCLTLIWSCKKEGEIITVSTGEVPTLAASATVLVLDNEDADGQALSFDWDTYQVSWSNDAVATPIIGYTLQLAKAGDNFQNILLSRDTDETAASFTNRDINTALISAQASPGEVTALQARLRVTIAANRQEYSNTIDLQVTPYDDVVSFPSLYLAGGFNGWSHSEDFRVASVGSDNNYEGYIYFPDPNTEFKFSSVAGWEGTNYGAGGPDALDSDGGASNLSVALPGYYLLKANTEELTWSATATTWGLIGDAVGGWNAGDDVVLTYDPENRVWRGTVTMVPGTWKFRANGGWDLNLGSGGQAGVLAYGGPDFNAEVGGTYVITLDLSNAGQYTYTIE